MRLSEDLLSNQPVLDELARSVGVSSKEARRIVSAVLPELASAMERNTLSRGGLADLVAFMGRGAPDQLLDQPDWISDPARSKRVNDYGVRALDLTLGSKDRSRALANRVERCTGADAKVVRDLLPAIAAVAMGGMRRETAPAFGDIFGRARINREEGIGQTAGRSASPQRSGGDIPEQAPLPLPGEMPRGGYEGGGYNAPAGRQRRAEPANERTPYDDLSDILRRGGFGNGGQGDGSSRGGGTVNLPGGGNADGGVLWSIVRELIGAVLGFQSRGIVGWIIRVIVLRYGWQFVVSILRRLLLGGRAASGARVAGN